MPGLIHDFFSKEHRARAQVPKGTPQNVISHIKRISVYMYNINGSLGGLYHRLLLYRYIGTTLLVMMHLASTAARPPSAGSSVAVDGRGPKNAALLISWSLTQGFWLHIQVIMYFRTSWCVDLQYTHDDFYSNAAVLVHAVLPRHLRILAGCLASVARIPRHSN